MKVDSISYTLLRRPASCRRPLVVPYAPLVSAAPDGRNGPPGLRVRGIFGVLACSLTRWAHVASLWWACRAGVRLANGAPRPCRAARAQRGCRGLETRAVSQYLNYTTQWYEPTFEHGYWPRPGPITPLMRHYSNTKYCSL